MSPTRAALPLGLLSQLPGVPDKQSAAPGRYFEHHAAHVIFPAGHAALTCPAIKTNSMMDRAILCMILPHTFHETLAVASSAGALGNARTLTIDSVDARKCRSIRRGSRGEIHCEPTPVVEVASTT